MVLKRQATETLIELQSKEVHAAPKTLMVDNQDDTATQMQYIKNGFGKPMSPYEILLDKRISAAGVVQSLAGIYTAIAMGLPADKADEFVEEKARFMLALIQRLATEAK